MNIHIAQKGNNNNSDVCCIVVQCLTIQFNTYNSCLHIQKTLRQTSQKVLFTKQYTANVFSKQKSNHVERMIQCRATDFYEGDENKLGRDRMSFGVRMQTKVIFDHDLTVKHTMRAIYFCFGHLFLCSHRLVNASFAYGSLSVCDL